MSVTGEPPEHLGYIFHELTVIKNSSHFRNAHNFHLQYGLTRCVGYNVFIGQQIRPINNKRPVTLARKTVVKNLNIRKNNPEI